MGIFDRIFGSKKQLNRWDIPAEEIDRAQRLEASEKFRKKVYKKYYSDYPEKPFISLDRELYTGWFEQSDMFSGQTVARSMMTRYDDGLLPGHVYMLYWLNKYSSERRVPSYFEYKYGIDFCKEKSFLLNKGLLGSDDKPTKTGLAAIEGHRDIIEEQHPAPKKSGAPLIPAPEQGATKRVISYKTKSIKEHIPDTDKPLLRAEFDYVNEMIKFACNLAGLHFPLSISPTRFVYGLDLWETHYECTPHTPSGKLSKYPLMLRYVYEPKCPPLSECFGELYYLQNGQIGKARLIFWRKKIGYSFYLGQTKNKLAVKKVVKATPPSLITLYKE